MIIRPYIRPYTIALMALVACNRESRSGTVELATGAVVRDSAGTTIVENHAPTWTETTRWKFDIKPIVTIGGDDSDPKQQFKYIRTARRLSTGGLAVLGDGPIRLFDSIGKFEREIGENGDGPGEFRSIGAVHLLPGDTLFVAGSMIAEAAGFKSAYFDRNGKLLREVFPDNAKYQNLGRWAECANALLADGSRLACAKDPTIPETEENRFEQPGHLRQVFRVYFTPPSLDHASPLGLEAGVEQFGVAISPGRTVFLIHPYYTGSYFADGGTPRRIAILTNPAYRIELWTPEGKLDRVITRDNGRRVPGSGDTAGVRDALLRYMLPPYQNDAVLREKLLASVPTPDSMPAAHGLIMGPHGELLVWREGWLPSHTESLFDVFDAKGAWLGELRLPGRARPVELGENYLVVVRKDENDLQRAEVFRLVKQGLGR